MGLDVEMMARSSEPLTDQEVSDLASAFAAEFGPPDEYGYPCIEREPFKDDGGRIVRIDTLDRFYGPGYSRGDWPRIRAMGDWLMVRFGEAGEVRYGADCQTGWDELAPYPLMRRECEEHWNTHGHSPYRDACNCGHCATLPASFSGSSAQGADA